MDEHRLAITYDPGEKGRALLERSFAGSARLTFLENIPEAELTSELSVAEVLLSWVPARELNPDEWDKLGGVRLIQLLSAGVDHFPFENLPSGITVASNVGAYAEPMPSTSSP